MRAYPLRHPNYFWRVGWNVHPVIEFISAIPFQHKGDLVMGCTIFVMSCHSALDENELLPYSALPLSPQRKYKKGIGEKTEF